MFPVFSTLVITKEGKEKLQSEVTYTKQVQSSFQPPLQAQLSTHLMLDVVAAANTGLSWGPAV